MVFNKVSLVVLIIGAALLVPFVLHAEQPEFVKVKGIRAVDGDTIVVQLDGTRMDVRYASINAPGLDQCMGKEATAFNDELIKGKEIWLDVHPVKGGYEMGQGRVLAHVFLSATPTQTSSVSVLLVKAGMARLDVFNPSDTAIRNGDDFSVRYTDLIISAQTEAIKARRGIWGECDGYLGSDLKIAAVKQWSDDEIVYILNRGKRPIDLAAGWTLTDSSASDRNSLDLSEHITGTCLLPPGGIMRVHSGSIATGRGDEHTPCDQQAIDFYWTGRRIWNQDKDEARLYSPDRRLVDVYPYPLDWK